MDVRTPNLTGPAMSKPSDLDATANFALSNAKETAVVDAEYGLSLSWEDLVKKRNLLVESLLRSGFKRGDCLAVLSYNSFEVS